MNDSASLKSNSLGVEHSTAIQVTTANTSPTIDIINLKVALPPLGTNVLIPANSATTPYAFTTAFPFSFDKESSTLTPELSKLSDSALLVGVDQALNSDDPESAFNLLLSGANQSVLKAASDRVKFSRDTEKWSEFLHILVSCRSINRDELLAYFVGDYMKSQASERAALASATGALGREYGAPQLKIFRTSERNRYVLAVINGYLDLMSSEQTGR